MDTYEIVNQKIIAAIEAGSTPWRKPWRGLGLQKNLISGKAYQGLNQFFLSMSDRAQPYWLTYKQAADLGGNVRKGEKGEKVVFWKINEYEKEDGSKKSVPFLRYSTVFNIDQIDGIKAPESEENKPLEFEPIESAETISAGYIQRSGLKLEHAGSRAYYSPLIDSVRMPQKTDFSSVPEYYSTLFHELGHSTGHESRLKREGITETHFFGDAVYSKEELVAEFTAAFLCARSGIENTIDNSAAYLRGWLTVLKNNKTWLVSAASQAQKAADYILNSTAKTEEV